MQIQNPVLTGSLTLNGLNITTGNIVTTGSNVFLGNQTITGSVNISGSLIVTTTAPELTVQAAGVILGNLLTDSHSVTGSLRITGSLNTIGNACMTSVCSPSFVGGTVTGTTLYGSTVICGASICTTGNICAAGSITGSSILATGRITAQTLVVSTISSSVTFSSGSNIFGNSLTNTQTMTGSVNITGSLNVFTAGTSPEFQVAVGGTTKGNALTDVHNVTGSLRITGSNALFDVGCVGIGNISPAANLHVLTPSTGTGVIFRYTGGTNNPGLFVSTEESTKYVRLTASGTSVSGQLLQLGAEGTAGVVNIGVANVGIGTCSPQSLLDVTSTGTVIHTIKTTSTSGARDAQLRLSVANTGTNDSAGRILFTYSTNFTEAARIEAVSDSGGNWADLRFGTGASGTERMRITSTGIACFACQVCAPTFRGGSSLQLGGYAFQFTAAKNFNENTSDVEYFKIAMGSGQAAIFVQFSSHNSDTAAYKMQTYHGLLSNNWTGWMGCGIEVTGNPSCRANFAASSINSVATYSGCLVFRVSTTNNGTSTISTGTAFITVVTNGTVPTFTQL